MKGNARRLAREYARQSDRLCDLLKLYAKLKPGSFSGLKIGRHTGPLVTHALPEVPGEDNQPGTG